MPVVIGFIISIVILGITIFFCTRRVKEANKQRFSDKQNQEKQLHDQQLVYEKEIDYEKHKLELEYKEKESYQRQLGMQADQLQSFINDLNNQKTTLNRLINNLQTQINSKNNQLTDIESKIKTKETTYQYVQQSYIAQIEEAYSKAEKEFDDKINNLKEKYEIINTEREKLIATIKKLQDTYTAVLEAAQRSEENKTNVLIISKKDKTDLDIINSIKDRLQQPRVLNMAIWTGYYKKAMDKLCVDIIGIKDKTGIYRITNIQTNQCYIGQAVNGIGR